MAKIITSRPEAAQYNGRTGKFVRDVVGGPAFNPLVAQVIVNFDGVDLYFFANEVRLDEDEGRMVERQAEDLKAERAKQDKLASDAKDAKLEHFKSFSRGADEKKKDGEPKAAAPKPPPVVMQAAERPIAGPGAPASAPADPAGTGPVPSGGSVG